jgi:exosortase/archaeosortase family protein
MSRAKRQRSKTKPEDHRSGILRSVLGFFSRRPVLRFITLVSVLMGLFYGLVYFPKWDSDVASSAMSMYLGVYAKITALILGVLGNDVTVYGQSVTSPRYSIQIARECSALEPTALFVAGVLALQVRRGTRWIGVVLGVLSLAITNVVRIVSLFYVGIYIPSKFDMIHIEVWQALFIVLAIAYWAVWAMWATRVRTIDSDVTG